MITVVVATRNRWTDLERSLPRHPPPVILVDNGSDDGTPDRVRQAFPWVELIELGENQGAVARNHGVRAARTPCVAFADDDSWWHPGALDVAADCFAANPRLGLLAARILLGDEGPLEPVCVEMAGSPLPREPDLPGPSVLGFIACGAVVRREAFLAAGGFDPVVFFAGEEERLALDLAALGWGLAYVDTVVAHHRPSSSRDVDPARRARIARNELLTALMRRPWPVVSATLRRMLASGPPGRAGALQVLPRLPAALARRRVLPPSVETRRVLLG